MTSFRSEFAGVRECLAAQREAYRLLLTLSRAQKEVFASSGVKGLMKVIARKQAAIGEISALGKRIEEFAREWEGAAALPRERRREIEEAAADIKALKETLAASEREMEMIVAAAREETAGRMKNVSGGLAATRAYNISDGGAAAKAGRYLDREG